MQEKLEKVHFDVEHGKRLSKKGFNKKSSQMSSLRCMHRELATDAVHIM